MRVSKGEKTLFHIQCVNEWSDEPFDTFVYSESFPTPEQVRQLHLDENGDIGDSEMADYMKNYNVYTVYAEEL